jgi:hypothetical protein
VILLGNCNREVAVGMETNTEHSDTVSRNSGCEMFTSERGSRRFPYENNS